MKYINKGLSNCTFYSDCNNLETKKPVFYIFIAFILKHWYNLRLHVCIFFSICLENTLQSLLRYLMLIVVHKKLTNFLVLFDFFLYRKSSEHHNMFEISIALNVYKETLKYSCTIIIQRNIYIYIYIYILHIRSYNNIAFYFTKNCLMYWTVAYYGIFRWMNLS